MKTKNKTYCLAASGLCVALTVICAQLIIVLPFTPVQITLSVCAVYLTGVLLPKSWAAYAQIAYILLGVIGVPVFGKFSSGLGTIAGPTGGYILVYPIMAFAVALIIQKIPLKSKFASYLIAMLAALIICYIGGSIWFSLVGHYDYAKSLALTVVPFIVFDLIKIILCSVLAVVIVKSLSKQIPAFQE